MALDTCKGMAYLHCHKCVLLTLTSDTHPMSLLMHISTDAAGTVDGDTAKIRKTSTRCYVSDAVISALITGACTSVMYDPEPRVKAKVCPS